MATKKQTEQYGNSSISMLKGEDRVRKRPAVIFGSDDLEGCKHAVFEILSNAIDEAREGHGDTSPERSDRQGVGWGRKMYRADLERTEMFLHHQFYFL